MVSWGWHEKVEVGGEEHRGKVWEGGHVVLSDFMLNLEAIDGIGLLSTHGVHGFCSLC